MENSDIHILSKYQGNLFEKSVEFFSCSSYFFIKKFMHSNLAKRMDRISFLNESLDIYAAFEELSKEKQLEYGKVKIPTYMMSWIGYLYRYWSLKYNVSSRWLYKNVKPSLLVNIYEAYHSLDVDECINRINESLNLVYGIDRLKQKIK